MRVAKQKRSDDRTVRARQMAATRISNLYHQIDDETEGSMIRAVEANREMHKMQVLSQTELGRRNKFIAKNASTTETRKVIRTNHQDGMVARKNNTSAIRSSNQQTGHVVRQPTRAQNQKFPAQRKNSTQVRETVQQKKPAQARAPVQRRQPTRAQNVPRSNQTRHPVRVEQRTPVHARPQVRNTRPQAKPQPRHMTQNPAMEARKRRMLEAKIRELANK